MKTIKTKTTKECYNVMMDIPSDTEYELQEFRYTIPEGYEAEIVDGEVIIIKKSESEDERIWKWILEKVQGYATSGIPISSEIEMAYKAIAWLKKQKELPTNEEMLRTLRTEYEKGVADTIAKYEQKEQKPAEPSNDELERHQKELYDFKVFAAKQAKEHHISFVHDFEWNNFCAEILSYFNEQKPAYTEDMPYIADERFFEREPKDSFKYKLAEYMTKCCTKKEGQYGYEYGISAETILKMAEEELLKRGVVQRPSEYTLQCSWSTSNYQKPVKWGEEDAVYFADTLWCIEQAEKIAQSENDLGACWSARKWLKSLRPQPKAEWSEEDRKMIDHLIEALPMWANGLIAMLPSQADEYVKRLKSLRPSWKPSKEQMESLKECGECKLCIKELYEQLKKLM